MGEIINFANRHDRRREGYRIVVSTGLWRGYDVTVEPPTSTHPLRHAKTYNEAMLIAQVIHLAEGWPIFSSTAGDVPPGGHAA